MEEAPHELDHHPELIHHIQSLLPAREAARTCILSKSWLHAWSTIPTLRFGLLTDCNEQDGKHLDLEDDTLVRYLRDNLPIERLHLPIYIVNRDLASRTEKWIRLVASKSCLKELSLSIWVPIASFTLPDEILSGKNLNKIMVRRGSCYTITPCMSSNPWIHYVWIGSNPVINCVSLRVLELIDVGISEQAIHNLLSICCLLEKIKLERCKGLKTIKVKNLCCLSEFKLSSIEENNVLAIKDVPNLRLFCYKEKLHERNDLPFNTGSFANVTELQLHVMIMDDEFFDMMKSKVPFLEGLTLGMQHCILESFDITCVSLKRLTLSMCTHMLIDVQVNAPKLVYFCYYGEIVPSLLFPSMTPEQIKISLRLYTPPGNSFFLKMREALALPSKFYIDIGIYSSLWGKPSNIDVDDLRREVPFPATNVQELSLETCSEKGLWEQSALIDAFFWICHPKSVVARYNNYLWKVMVRKFMEKKTTKTKEEEEGYCWHDYLEHVELRSKYFGEWETQTDSWESFLDGLTRVKWEYLRFIPNWYSSIHKTSSHSSSSSLGNIMSSSFFPFSS